VPSFCSRLLSRAPHLVVISYLAFCSMIVSQVFIFFHNLDGWTNTGQAFVKCFSAWDCLIFFSWLFGILDYFERMLSPASPNICQWKVTIFPSPYSIMDALKCLEALDFSKKLCLFAFLFNSSLTHNTFFQKGGWTNLFEFLPGI
jgi:hypothetical protein